MDFHSRSLTVAARIKLAWRRGVRVPQTSSACLGLSFNPNRADDPEYIVRLVGHVIYVSLETVRIVNSLPSL